jgi:hypothetical protein
VGKSYAMSMSLGACAWTFGGKKKMKKNNPHPSAAKHAFLDIMPFSPLDLAVIRLQRSPEYTYLKNAVKRRIFSVTQFTGEEGREQS